jgi:ribosomal protein L24E
VNTLNEQPRSGAIAGAKSSTRSYPNVRNLIAIAGLTVLPAVLVLGATAGATISAGPTASSPTASGAPHGRAPTVPAPVTKAYPQSRQGILPPGNPPANIAPSPNFLSYCSGSQYDDSSACVSTTLAAIANGREAEGLPGLVLPTNWSGLSPQEQMFVATNLERTVRGLAPLSGMASALDGAAAGGAAQSNDPQPPAGFPWSQWGSNWAGAVGNPLEADYFWMYDDGPGSSNIDCPQAGASGCWGHRDNILLGLACQPCEMGTGFDATGYQGYPGWAELLVDTSGSPALDFSWAQETPYLTGNAAGLTAPAVGIASTPDGGGYWMVSANGGVFSFGDATFYNSLAGDHLNQPIVGIAATPDGHGYWLVASDGGVFAFGNAGYYGSTGGIHLNKPVVGIAATPDGHGYWLVASDGGIFTFGDAGFHGSMGAHPLNKPVVGIASSPNGHGYWEVASDGGIFAFGNAGFYGSTGAIRLNKPVVAMESTNNGTGYWMVASDGGIFAFGNASFHGSTGGTPLVSPVVGMTAPSQVGYWLGASDGGVFSFGVPFHGSIA